MKLSAATKKFVFGMVALNLAVSAYATMGFLKGEQVSGMNKICYYDVLGSMKTINVSSAALCPSTYNF